jgi:hypothetical protein
MPYIGVSPQFGVRKKHTYTATAGQTSFSGAGSEGATLSYTDSNFVDVYQNGVKLGDADYTSTSGTAIVLAQGASVDDLIEIIVFDAFSAADTVSKADGGTFDNPVTITTADNSVNLNLVSTDADANSGPELELYRNSASPADNDFVGTISFQAENDAGEKIEYGVLKTRIVDASDGTEDFRMTFEGKVAGSDVQLFKMDNSNIVFNEDSKDIDFRVESDGNANMLVVDAGNDQVGIGTDSPQRQLHIAGGSNTGLKISGNSSGATSSDGFDIFVRDDNSGVELVQRENTFMTFHTNNTERMRIDANGRMQITSDGQASFTSDASLEVRGQNAPLVKFNHNQNADEVVLQIRHDQARSGQTATMVQILNNSNSEVGTIKANVSATAFNTSSDYRLKENVSYNFDATSRLKQLKPARFNFIADETNTTVDGFLAHEVSDIVPEAITGEKDAMTKEVLYANGDEIPNGKKVGDVKEASKIAPQGIDQSKLVPLLTKTLQEALTRIDTLEAKVIALEKGE